MSFAIRSLAKILLVCMMFTMLIVPAYATETADNTVRGEIVLHEKAKADKELFNKVPTYSQNDYPNTPYGNGTIKSSGCGITSLAMVASYLLNDEILPDELAEEFGSRRDSNVGRMLYAADTLGLTYTKTFEFNDVKTALEEGKVAIVLLNETSKLTNSQHLVVYSGITSEGLIIIKDPNSHNWTRYEKEFTNGFKQSSASNGFSGAWIFDNP